MYIVIFVILIYLTLFSKINTCSTDNNYYAKNNTMTMTMTMKLVYFNT